MTVGLLLLPNTAQASPPEPLEAHSPVQSVTYTPTQPLPVPVYDKALALQEVAVVSNPCHSGCGYAPANCTQWAAILRERLGNPVGDDWGDAKDWPGSAQALGVATGSLPKVGAVAVSQSGVSGHVMVVEDVYADGSFKVSEQNYDYMGSIRERVVPDALGLTFIY